MDARTLKQTAQGTLEVRFCVDVAAYLRPPLHEPYGLYFSLQEVLREAFGDHVASVSVGSREGVLPDAEHNGKNCEWRGILSECRESIADSLPPEKELSYLFGKDSRRWTLSLFEAGRIDSIPADPQLGLSLADRVLTSKRRIDVVELLRAAFGAIDRHGQCYFGLVDVNPPYMGGGELYRRYPARPLHWRAEVGHIDWLLLGEQRPRHVRDVYWGMYLSAFHLGRLPGGFCEEFLSVETEGERPQSVTRFRSGAALLLMSDDPLDAPFPFPSGGSCPALRNGVWVRGRLREAGLL